MMYADVVMEKAGGMKPAEGVGIRKLMDEELDKIKKIKATKTIRNFLLRNLNSLPFSINR